MTKKIISAILICAFVLTMGLMPLSAASFGDVEGKSCEKAVDTLAALGVVSGMDDATFAPEATLTRGQAAAMMVRIVGNNVSSGTVANPFTDISEFYWGYSEIMAAYQLGVIDGMGDGTFLPDEQVTYPQVVKMLITLLGYKVPAEALGGYPAGYLIKANELGITDGVTAIDGAITRGDTAILIYNALDTNVLEKTSYGNDDEIYEVADYTLLSKYQNIEFTIDVVNADYFTTISPADRTLKRGEIAIGGMVYKIGSSNASDYLGRKVKVYYEYKDSDDIPTIIHCVPQNGTDIVVSAENILGETTKTRFKYKVNGKEKEVSIKDGTPLIYNGRQIEGWTRADLMPTMGEVRLVSTSGSGEADTVIVNEYTNYTVNSKDKNKKIVYFRGSVDGVTDIAIDVNDPSYKSEYLNADGTEFDIDAVKKWDILSVYRSKDNEIVKVRKSSTIASGKVNEVSDDYIMVDGTKYSVDEGAKSEILVSSMLNVQATFYLDYKGYIADVDQGTGEGFRYGYLLGAKNSKGLSGAGQFKVFTDEGKMVVYNAADRVLVNGDSYAKEDVCDKIPMRELFDTERAKDKRVPEERELKRIYTKTGETIEQLIKFKVNEDGTKITELLTAQNHTNDATDFAGASGFNMIFENSKDQRAMMPFGDGSERGVKDDDVMGYTGGTNCSFATRFLIRKKTKIFVIPKAGSADNKYEIIPYTKLKINDEGGSYEYTSLFDIDSTFVCGAMVWDKSRIEREEVKLYTDGYESPFGVVTKVSESINEDLDKVTNIKVMDFDGLEKNFYVDDPAFRCGYRVANTDINKDKYSISFQGASDRNSMDITIKPTELAIGDIIQYDADGEGALTCVEVLYRAATPGFYENTVFSGGFGATAANKNYYGGLLVGSGTVREAGENGIVVNTALTNGKGQKKDDVLRVYGTQGVLGMIDMRKGTYNPINLDQIAPGDVCVSVWKTHNQRMFIVYRNLD